MNTTKYLNKRMTNLLIFGCWFLYCAAYIGRKDYNAGAATLALGLTGNEAGLITSAFAITYGLGQLVNGILCRFYNPKYVLSGAMLVSVASNLMMPVLCENPRLMAVSWFVNGITQSILWSLIIRTLSHYIADNEIGKAIYVMSTPVAAGTAGAYGLSALFAGRGHWVGVFYLASGVMAVAAVIWFIIMSRVEKAMKNGETIEVEEPVNAVDSDAAEKKSGRKTITLAFGILLGVVALTAIANGFIKDGINEWTPAILKEQFDVGDSLSIILSVVLPLLSVLGAIISKKMHDFLKDHLLIDGIFYLVSFGLTFAVLKTLQVNSVPLTMTLFIGVACMMSAVNNVITSMIPLNYRKQMDSGFLAGALDTVCYVGGALAGVWLGSVEDNRGWNMVFTLLIVFSAISAVLSFAVCVFYRLRTHQKT